jgi:hypothetical protein
MCVIDFFLCTGRASSSPIIDLFITLLSLGSTKYIALVKERKELHQKLREGLAKVALRFGQRVLDTPGNAISVGNLKPEIEILLNSVVNLQFFFCLIRYDTTHYAR